MLLASCSAISFQQAVGQCSARRPRHALVERPCGGWVWAGGRPPRPGQTSCGCPRCRRPRCRRSSRRGSPSRGRSGASWCPGPWRASRRAAIFERGVGRLGARAGEEHIVQPCGRQLLRCLVGQLRTTAGGRTGRPARNRAGAASCRWPRRSRGGHGPGPRTTGRRGRQKSCGLRRRCSRRRCAATIMRGLALNWRLPVNGIQCASSQAASVRTGLWGQRR